MSEAALRKSASKRHWAEPGSRHDRLVRLAKFGLPLLGLALIAVLAISPFDKRGDVSFILDKKGVDKATERMRIESARYSGEDDKGNKFTITANRAIQQRSDVPVVMIEGMMATLGLAQGPVEINAMRGQYDLDNQMVQINGPVKVAGTDGYRLETSNVQVDMKQRSLQSRGRVTGAMTLGTFEAGQMHADLASRTVVLDGGVRLKIVQGAVR
ncbi:MAG: LPS export ABC transporter periplasmic protein LptC [Sphingomicrobium sp.]